jgi:hypothetical protein
MPNGGIKKVGVNAESWKWAPSAAIVDAKPPGADRPENVAPFNGRANQMAAASCITGI